MLIARRSFLRGLVAMPAVVAASSIMPARATDALILRSGFEPALHLPGGITYLDHPSLMLEVTAHYAKVAWEQVRP